MTMVLSKQLTGSLFVAFAWMLLAWPTSAWACPNCDNTVAANSDQMALAYAASIAVMLIVPGLLVFIWGVALRQAVLSTRRALVRTSPASAAKAGTAN